MPTRLFLLFAAVLGLSLFLQESPAGEIRQGVVIATDGWPEPSSGDTAGGIHGFSDSRVFAFAVPEEARAELRSDPSEVIWKATNEWSVEWERRYSEWVEAEFTEDFYYRHGIATDCADAAIALRWIFARIHGLPMVSSIGPRNWFSHRSLRASWKALPTAEKWHEDQRFRAALKYLLDFAYTHSLFDDSYPIRLSPEHFTAGSFIVELGSESGHTQIFARVKTDFSQGAPMVMLASTVPSEVRMLSRYSFFEGGYLHADSRSIRKYRWPLLKEGVVGLVRSREMPGYSLEQFSPDFVQEGRNLAAELIVRLCGTLDLKQVVIDLFAQIETFVRERIVTVSRGYGVCGKTPAECTPGSRPYEAWSTPSRDRRLGEVLAAPVKLLEYAYTLDIQLFLDLRQMYRERMLGTFFEIGDRRMSLSEVDYIWKEGLFSSDPVMHSDLRWGVRDLESDVPRIPVREYLRQYREEKEQALGITRPEMARDHVDLGVAFHVLPEQVSGPVRALYRCRRGGEYAASVDPTCEGFAVEETLGWVSLVPTKGALPVLVFYSNRTGDTWVTLRPESVPPEYAFVKILGYAWEKSGN